MLLCINLPSHPPDPVIEVVADDAELPYLRGIAHMRTYAGAVIVSAHSDDAQGLRCISSADSALIKFKDIPALPKPKVKKKLLNLPKSVNLYP